MATTIKKGSFQVNCDGALEISGEEIGQGHEVRDLLRKGVEEGVYPGAVLRVSRGDDRILFEAVGYRSLIPHRASMSKETLFDLASLTKPLATTLSVMKAVDGGRIGLDEPLEALLSVPVPQDKKEITLRLLLCHASGFPDWRPFYLRLEQGEMEKRKETLRKWLLEMPLTYSPGKGSLYSDLGFMMLEWIVEERTGMSLTSILQDHFYGPLGLSRTFLYERNRPKRFPEEEFASTEDCPWRGKVLHGVVHDENAYALGGYCGHAGLFGTAAEVHKLMSFLRGHYLGVRMDYYSQDTVREFFKRQCIPPESTWALGWDTPSVSNSSAGTRFSRHSVGHLGFTGTSIWMDLDQDVTVIFLTNRVHPSRNNDRIKAFRPKLHDLIMETLG